MSCPTADCKVKQQHVIGQSSQTNYSKQQQGEEEGEKLPRLPYKIAPFLELLSLGKLYQLCEALSVTNFIVTNSIENSCCSVVHEAKNINYPGSFLQRAHLRLYRASRLSSVLASG